MIGRIVLAVVVAIVVGLVCILLGGILVSINVPIADTVGSWFRTYGWALGILAGLWWFFSGRTWTPPAP